MNGTYIISDYTNKMNNLIDALQIDESNIISNKQCLNEKEYHIWLTTEFKNNNIEKIIIPLSLPTDAAFVNTDGLLIALHIRLNYEIEIEKRLIPIVLLSNFTLENIIKFNNFDKDNNPQNLIFTKGIYFSSFDIEDIILQHDKAVACRPEQYKTDILPKLNIQRKATVGNHDIANAWGCYKLAEVVGSKDDILRLDAISNHLMQLYAKFLICKNDSFKTNVSYLKLEPLECQAKNILFIDDKSDEGWGVIMKKIFKNAGDNFVAIDSSVFKTDDFHKPFADFNGFYEKCQSYISQKWDLIIIDIRLNPEKEDIDNENIKPEDFTGYKLIDEFLSYNEGRQIIVFTASNKVWNVNAALKRGAYSYYIKESPQFNYSIRETKQHYENFKEDVRQCLKRHYLRDIFAENKQLIEHIYSLSYDDNFKGEIENQLNISYTLLSEAKSKEQFAYAYVSLYMIIEIVNTKFITKDSQDYWLIDNSINLENIEYEQTTGQYIIQGTVQGAKPPEWKKIAGLYRQKWKQTDFEFIRKLYPFIQKRNGFVHNSKTILDKKNENYDFYFNHDIYNELGFIDLYQYIKKIVYFL